MVQAAINMPLTVYGHGTQKRTFLNINDTLQCVELAIKNPAKPGVYKVRNQFTETFDIMELANLTKKAAFSIGLNLKIKKLKNPRVEMTKHYYKPTNKSFLKIGLNPKKLNVDFIASNLKKIYEKKILIDKKIIQPKIKWKN